MANENIRLVHIDGKLPNLALMKLGHWHRSIGDRVVLTRHVQPSMFEPVAYDRVYGSAIFTRSIDKVAALLSAYPDAVVGGTGSGRPLDVSVEDAIGVDTYEHYDYGLYPDYPWSIGFTQRGCRLRCGFCVVPGKEGRPRSVNSIWEIWRVGSPRAVVLLDNDFFGQPADQWRARIAELRDGGFKVNFSQGINIRLIDDEAAAALASVKYYDGRFLKRRLYTAWDNLGQERVFFRGLETLREAGIPPRHLMVYMLIGYAPKETMGEILYRYLRLKDAGCKPYPMVYNDGDRLLKAFQRWVVRRFDEIVPWEQYRKTVARSGQVRLSDGIQSEIPQGKERRDVE